MRQDYFLQPFEKNLWLAITTSIIIGTAFAWLLQKILKSNRFFVDNLFLVFETFSNQIGNEDMKNISFRFFYLIISMVSIVVANSYAGIITAFLAIEIPEIPFRNFPEFIRNGQYQLAMNKDETLLFYLKVIS